MGPCATNPPLITRSCLLVGRAVIKKIGKVNYQIEMTGKRKTKKIFHVNMLRLYYPSTFVGFVQETNCTEDGDGSGRLLAHLQARHF